MKHEPHVSSKRGKVRATLYLDGDLLEAAKVARAKGGLSVSQRVNRLLREDLKHTGEIYRVPAHQRKPLTFGWRGLLKDEEKDAVTLQHEAWDRID